MRIGPYDLDHIYLDDCLTALPKLENACVDLVITDPPFGIDFKSKRSNYNRTQGRVLDGYNEIPAEEYYEFSLAWMREIHRILKESGSMYLFSGWNYLKDILVALDELGFITVNHLIWKFQFGVFTKRRYVTSHYHCIYVCKDDRKRKFHPYSRFSKEETDTNGGKLHYQDKEDVWQIQREYWHGKKKTPTKLPKELVEKILLYSSDPGDIVLDPFIGSGQVAVVSKMHSRHFLGFEIVEDYYNFAKERLDTNAYTIDHEEDEALVEQSNLPLFED